jgi:hypothetical protein
MQEPKILFFLAVWKRPEITELCFMGLQRLMKHTGARTMAVISEKSMIPLCKKYGIDFIEHENEPLGRKKNAGLTAAMKMDFDYLIELGSDDLILDTLFEYYLPLMRSGEDFFGSNKILFVDATSGETRSYTAHESEYGYGWGLGRCMSRKMIESFGGKVKILAKDGLAIGIECIGQGATGYVPASIASSLVKSGLAEILEAEESYYLWSDEAMKCLDNDSSKRINEKGFSYKTVDTPGPLMADIKSDENIWGFNPEIGEKGSLDFLENVSKAERQMFFANMKKLKARRLEHA